MEESFEKVDGVLDVISGYSGGTTKNPTYKEVTYGNTGHFEVVKIIYDVEKVRNDFPILSREVYGKPLVYLDSAASAQKPKKVIEQIKEFQEKYQEIIIKPLYSCGGDGVFYLKENDQNIFIFFGFAHLSGCGSGQFLVL